MTKIYVREGWGQKKSTLDTGPEQILDPHSPLMQITAAMRHDPEKGEELRKIHYEASVELRALMVKRKIEVVDSPNPIAADSLQEDEYTMLGAYRLWEQEVEEIQAITPEVNIPPHRIFREAETDPQLPVVVKPRIAAKGDGKYLIETPEQWGKFCRYMNEGLRIAYANLSNEAIVHILLDEGIITPDFIVTACAPDSTDEFAQLQDKIQKYREDHKHESYEVCPPPSSTDDVIIQNYIESPGRHYTSLRVIVTAKGTILASTLLHSGHSKSENKLISCIPNETTTAKQDCLENERSALYLAARDCTSNVATGGGIIPLNPTENSVSVTDHQKAILTETGFNAENPALSEEVAEAVQKLAPVVGRKKSLVTGFDFIQGKDGKWYLLEINATPGMQSYNAVHRNGAPDEVESYLQIHRAAIEELAN